MSQLAIKKNAATNIDIHLDVSGGVTCYVAGMSHSTLHTPLFFFQSDTDIMVKFFFY